MSIAGVIGWPGVVSACGRQGRWAAGSAATTDDRTGDFLTVAYWFLEGRPDRMDEERDGIPCETDHGADIARDIWNGGPVR